MMIKRMLLLIAVLMVAGRGYCQEDRDLGIQMVYVKGGNFFMGCDQKEYLSEEFDDERPLHRVNVGSFYIGKYEVTLGQWRKIMGVKPAAYDGTDYDNKDCDNCPVVKISYYDAQEFIRRLNAKYPGKNYRLPTETEWEFASRGGKYSKKYKYAGSDKLSDVGWYGKPNGSTHPIGQKQPNELSIYDMSGNVLEWCSDWYSESYYTKTIDEINPKGPETGTMKVLRGGSYYDDADVCRNVQRSKFQPSTRQWNIGFRLATDAQ
jgi:formylglycine-generating enzyme